jgi:hypothetical protein
VDYDGDSNTTDSSRQIRKENPSVSVAAPRDIFGEGAYFTDFNASFDNLVTGNRRRPQSSFRAKFHAGGNENFQFSRSSRLGSRSGFDQYVYDDGNRQYVLNQNLDYSYDTFRWFKANASWGLTFQQGVKAPPVQGDNQSYRQSFSYGAELTNRESWRWRLSSGFDLRHLPSRSYPSPNPLSSAFNWTPTRLSLQHNTGYDPRERRWQNTNITAT